MAGGPSKGWLHKIFGKAGKGKAKNKKSGLLDKYKKKGNPHY